MKDMIYFAKLFTFFIGVYLLATGQTERASAAFLMVIASGVVD